MSRAAPMRGKAAFAIPLDLEHTGEAPLGSFRIKTFNKISEQGLQRFPKTGYTVSADFKTEIHAILLRSHKLKVSLSLLLSFELCLLIPLILIIQDE